jgi:hypothetical protein
LTPLNMGRFIDDTASVIAYVVLNLMDLSTFLLTVLYEDT